jgi:hypothetical protein
MAGYKSWAETLNGHLVQNLVRWNLIKWLRLLEVMWLIVKSACKHLIHLVGINFICIIDFPTLVEKRHILPICKDL